jgi:hypothetical protein
MMNNEDLINEQIKIYEEEDRRRMRTAFWAVYIFLLFFAAFIVYYLTGDTYA